MKFLRTMLMNKKLISAGKIISADANGTIYSNFCVEINDNQIVSIKKYTDEEISSFSGEVIHAENLTVIPGFIQTHIHLCQTLFRGLADDLELLDWLQLRIFPYENAHDKKSLKASARIGIHELVQGGTTTILDMGTLNHQEVIFEELISSGMRAFAGKCMIDQNELFQDFKSDTDDEINITNELAKNFHHSNNGRIKYGFAPRFILSCSEKLLKETKELMKDYEGSIYHTHASENKKECEEIRKRYNSDNIEYFNSINVLGENTVLAHCVHTNENEIELLKKSRTRISHCPSSNLKLGSGVADVPRFIREGISVSLGADGAPCNNNLSAFNEMRLASLIQKPLHGPAAMDAKTIFYLATIEGARALHIDNETGSIEEGKKADMVFLDLQEPHLSLSDYPEDIYSTIVYSAGGENVVHVMIDGRWVVKNRVSENYDKDELFYNGKTELKNLLNRVY